MTTPLRGCSFAVALHRDALAGRFSLASTGERGLQRRHQIGDRGLRRFGCGDNLAALCLLCDQLTHAVFDLVFVVARIERVVLEVTDDLRRALELLGRWL